MMPTNGVLFGAGICCHDHIMVAPRVCWGDTAFVKEYCAQGGGPVATALVTCARLGAACQLISVLGDDSMGDQILAELRAEKVGVDQVFRVAAAVSPFSFIHVDQDSGERTIFHHRNANLRWPTTRRIHGLDQGHVLLIDDYYPELALAAAREARSQDVPIVADLTPSPENLELLREVDILIAPKQGLREHANENDIPAALTAIHNLGPATALITLGSDGWICSAPFGTCEGKAFPVPVVDTLGAGDVFHGAFAFGLAQRWEVPRCAEFASAVAGLKCARVGGRTGIPDRVQTMAFLRKYSKLDWN